MASASAEVLADIGLAPMEAAKVKIQTTPGYTDKLREAIPKIMKEEGLAGFYKGISSKLFSFFLQTYSLHE